MKLELHRLLHVKWRAFVVGLIKFAVAIAACTWLASRGYFDREMMSRIDAPALIAGFVLLGAQNAGNALRLHWLLVQHGLNVPIKRCLSLTWIGFAFNQLLPGGAGGDALRAYYTARDNPHAKMSAVTAAVVDKSIGLAGLLLLAAVPWSLSVSRPELFPLGALGLVRAISGAMTAALVGLAFVLALATSEWARDLRLSRWAAERVGLRLGGVVRPLYRALVMHRRSPLRLFGLVAMSALLHLLSCIVLLILARSIGNHESVALHLSLWSVTFLATAIPISPGGIGVAEAAAAELWLLCGVTTGAATYLALRLLSFVHAGLGLALYVSIRHQPGAGADATDVIH